MNHEIPVHFLVPSLCANYVRFVYIWQAMSFHWSRDQDTLLGLVILWGSKTVSVLVFNIFADKGTHSCFLFSIGGMMDRGNLSFLRPSEAWRPIACFMTAVAGSCWWVTVLQQRLDDFWFVLKIVFINFWF